MQDLECSTSKYKYSVPADDANVCPYQVLSFMRFRCGRHTEAGRYHGATRNGVTAVTRPRVTLSLLCDDNEAVLSGGRGRLGINTVTKYIKQGNVRGCGRGVLVVMHGRRHTTMRPSHPCNAGTEHVGFSPTRQCARRSGGVGGVIWGFVSCVLNWHNFGNRGRQKIRKRIEKISLCGPCT